MPTPRLRVCVALNCRARPYLGLNNTEQNPYAEPIEMARAIVFLASDLAGHISGASLPVDNGWCAA